VSVRIIIISTLGVIIQLGLTILAWGDWNSFFSHPARTWLVIGSFLLLIVAWFSGSSGISGGEKHSSASKTILYAFGVVILLLILVPSYCERRDIWVIDGDTIRYLGLFLFFAGSILRLAASELPAEDSSPRAVCLLNRIYVQSRCRGKYGLFTVKCMKLVASEFERDSHVEDIERAPVQPLGKLCSQPFCPVEYRFKIECLPSENPLLDVGL